MLTFFFFKMGRIDPLTGRVLGGNVKVFHSNGAYKTVPATIEVNDLNDNITKYNIIKK